jgi:hypothetical protein
MFNFFLLKNTLIISGYYLFLHFKKFNSLGLMGINILPKLNLFNTHVKTLFYRVVKRFHPILIENDFISVPKGLDY